MSYAQPTQSGRRLPGLVLVVLLHVALIYALVHGLARKIVEVVRQPLETRIVEEIKPPPPDKPPPPPPPRLAAPPPPYIPPPEITLQAPPTAPTITAVTTVKPTAPVPPPTRSVQPPSPVRTLPVRDTKSCDKPVYPPASLRANETGIVELSFLIDIDGRVLESKIERSSGFRRLDETAKNALGLCKYKPGTVDGKPERSRARIEYDWRID